MCHRQLSHRESTAQIESVIADIIKIKRRAGGDNRLASVYWDRIRTLKALIRQEGITNFPISLYNDT